MLSATIKNGIPAIDQAMFPASFLLDKDFGLSWESSEIPRTPFDKGGNSSDFFLVKSFLKINVISLIKSLISRIGKRPSFGMYNKYTTYIMILFVRV